MRCAQQILPASHIENALLLAGERGFRQVLCGRRRAHRDRDCVAAKLLPCPDQVLLERSRERRSEYPGADGVPRSGQRRDIFNVQARQLRLDALRQPIVRQKFSKGLRSRGKAGRDTDPEAAQMTDHLAQ